MKNIFPEHYNSYNLKIDKFFCRQFGEDFSERKDFVNFSQKVVNSQPNSSNRLPSKNTKFHRWTLMNGQARRQK